MSVTTAFMRADEALVIARAQQTGDYKTLRTLANYMAKHDDMENAEHLKKVADRMEHEIDWAYDEYVDNTLS